MSDLISTQESVAKIVDAATRKILSGEQKLTKEYEQAVKDAVNVILNIARRTDERHVNDLIGRRNAIDACLELWEARRKWDTAEGRAEMRGIDAVMCAIHDLPSAKPEPCGDVVSRNAIIQKLNTMDRYVSEELRLCDTDKKFPQNEVFIVDDVYEEIVENLPSAQPEDCDTCKHGYFGDGKCDNCRVRFPSHYERRADEGN